MPAVEHPAVTKLREINANLERVRGFVRAQATVLVEKGVAKQAEVNDLLGADWR